MCWDGDSRLGYTAAAIGVLLVLFAVPPLLIARARGDRVVATAVWIGPLALAGAFSGVGFALGAQDLLPHWVFGLAVGLAAGIGGAVMRKRPSLAVIGVLGGVAPLIAFFAAFVGLLAATGTCLD